MFHGPTFGTSFNSDWVLDSLQRRSKFPGTVSEQQHEYIIEQQVVGRENLLTVLDCIAACAAPPTIPKGLTVIQLVARRVMLATT